MRMSPTVMGRRAAIVVERWRCREGRLTLADIPVRHEGNRPGTPLARGVGGGSCGRSRRRIGRVVAPVGVEHDAAADHARHAAAQPPALALLRVAQEDVAVVDACRAARSRRACTGRTRRAGSRTASPRRARSSTSSSVRSGGTTIRRPCRGSRTQNACAAMVPLVPKVSKRSRCGGRPARCPGCARGLEHRQRAAQQQLPLRVQAGDQGDRSSSAPAFAATRGNAAAHRGGRQRLRVHQFVARARGVHEREVGAARGQRQRHAEQRRDADAAGHQQRLRRRQRAARTGSAAPAPRARRRRPAATSRASRRGWPRPA